MSVTTDVVWSAEQQAAIEDYEHRLLGVQSSMLNGIPLSRHAVRSVPAAVLRLDRAGVVAIYRGSEFDRFERKLSRSTRVDHINLPDVVGELDPMWHSWPIGMFVGYLRAHTEKELNLSAGAYGALSEYLMAHGFDDIRASIQAPKGTFGP